MRSDAAATAFLVFMLSAGFMAVSGCQATASRLTWSFARDSGLIASSRLCRIDTKKQVPIWALCANEVVIFIVGCIYLGSSTAFNAFISTGLILQLITFAIPAALLLVRKRSARFLPTSRTFGLPSAFGWVANFFTVAFALVCIVFYDFPAVQPVTSSNMSTLSSPSMVC
jgi:choline transport protein